MKIIEKPKDLKIKSLFTKFKTLIKKPKVNRISSLQKKLEREKKQEILEKKRKEKQKKKKESYDSKNLRKTIKKKIKQKKSAAQKKRFFQDMIEKAGIDTSLKDIKKNILFLSIFTVILESLYLIITYASKKALISKILFDTFVILTLGLVLQYLIFFIIFFFIIDLKIYNRKKSVEDVLPEYFQLVAANIGSGMPIDQSLWLAIRPQFGVLSKEMELVAKKSMTGTNLNTALIEFSEKYDSQLLKRTIYMLTEGIDAGGPIAKLLDRITVDMIDTKIMKKEMAANVMTYVIFITFASVAAAPFMFGLANQLIVIISGLIGNLNIGTSSNSMFNLTSDSILLGDFKLFAIIVLTISSSFAAMISSIIKNGNIRDGLKNIPILSAIAICIYLFASYIMSMVFSGMF